MISRINNILAKGIEDIIASVSSLELLDIYSKLYLNGSQPSTCANSLRAYYTEIQLTGLQRAVKLREAMERTNKPNWIGNRFVWGAFYNDQTITDEQAITLLKNGGLSETDFKVLPLAYKDEPKKDTWEQVKAKQDKPKNVKKPQPKK
jgi:hypothetical protein